MKIRCFVPIIMIFECSAVYFLLKKKKKKEKKMASLKLPAPHAVGVAREKKTEDYDLHEKRERKMNRYDTN